MVGVSTGVPMTASGAWHRCRPHGIGIVARAKEYADRAAQYADE
jgi:hypothetical protein